MKKNPRTFVFYDWMTLSKARHFHYEFHRIYESDKKCWTKLLEDNKVKYFRLLGNYSHEHIRKKFDEFCEYLPNITKKECSLKLRLTKSVLEFCVLAASEYSVESNTSQEDIERYEFWKKIRDDAKVLETKLDRKLLTYPRDVNDNKVRNRRVRRNIDYDLLGFLWKRNRVKYQCLEGMALFANIIGMMNEETNADEDCWPMLFPRYLPQRDLLLKRCAYINRANGEGKESEYATVYFYFSKRYDFRKDVSEILKTCQGAYDYNTYCIFDETMLDYKYLRVIIDNGELNGGRLTNVAMSLFELFLNSLKN